MKCSVTQLLQQSERLANLLCFRVFFVGKLYPTYRISVDKSMHVLCDNLELFADKFLKIIKQLTYMTKTKLDVVPKHIHVRIHNFQSNCMKIEPFRT